MPTYDHCTCLDCRAEKREAIATGLATFGIASLSYTRCDPAGGRTQEYYRVEWPCECVAYCAGYDDTISWLSRCDAHTPFALTPTDERDPGPAIVPAPVRRPVEDEETECEHCGNTGECEPCEECERCTRDCECRHCERCDRHSPDLDVCSACDTCAEHCCSCSVCNGCNRRGEDVSICDECDTCTDCCECQYCEGCDERFRPSRGRICGECDRCSDCCTCEEENDLLVNRDPEFYIPSKSQRKRNPSARLVGVEIEVASTGSDKEPIKDAARTWRCSIVEDGSLPSSGFEITTSPAGGDLFVDQIETLGKALRKSRATITQACGLHVHIDARDFRYYDMRRLVLLYAKLEDALFATQPSSRRHSHYCEPCGEKYAADLTRILVPRESKARLLANVYDGKPDMKRVKRDKYHSARYHALNLHSWVYRGTVECRLHTGSVEPKKIIAWGMLWASLLDYAMATTEQAIRGLALSRLDSAQTFLLDVIAPTADVRAYLCERWTIHNGSAPTAREQVA